MLGLGGQGDSTLREREGKREEEAREFDSGTLKHGTQSGKKRASLRSGWVVGRVSADTVSHCPLREQARMYVWREAFPPPSVFHVVQTSFTKRSEQVHRPIPTIEPRTKKPALYRKLKDYKPLHTTKAGESKSLSMFYENKSESGKRCTIVSEGRKDPTLMS